MNTTSHTTLFKEMAEATVKGDEERCVELARRAVQDKADLFQAIQEGYSRGMLIVGEKFASLEYYLPEVVVSAEAMTAAVEVLKPHLTQRADRGSMGTVVVGTIQGDLHDLGKNIVKIMLEAAGFTVHDLGADVPVRRFIDKAEEVKADIIAASAILTTTMTYMPDIVAILEELGLRNKYKIMFGGAPVIQEWVTEIGGDAYGEDANEAVQVALGLMREKRERGEK